VSLTVAVAASFVIAFGARIARALPAVIGR
jgi:hypothetical protein